MLTSRSQAVVWEFMRKNIMKTFIYKKQKIQI